jgi:DnaJ-domain-containing protein 1
MTQELLSRGDLSLAIQLLNACKNDNPELGKQLISSGANQIVKGYLDRGDVLSASKFVEENRGSIDFMTRLRLMAGRMNLSLMSFSLIVLISLGFGFWTVFRLFRRTDAAANDLEKYPEEYLEALATFGLSPKASVRNIKKAYRKAVKIHHPDLKQDSSREDQQFFIKLHMDYEALLKFHRQSK